jgi:hypothetical protein
MPAGGARQPIVGLALLGILVLAAAFCSPLLAPDADAADMVTRQTARVFVLFWGLAAAGLLLGHLDFGRAAWTVGCATFLIHVVTAFKVVHGWSHANAFEHVETVSGFGPGIFVSYAFALLWTTDAVWCWTDRRSYHSRPVWLDRLLHSCVAFVIFNGTVVYETGFVRWAGAILFGLLCLLMLWRRTGLKSMLSA